MLRRMVMSNRRCLLSVSFLQWVEVAQVLVVVLLMVLMVVSQILMVVELRLKCLEWMLEVKC